jgi:hypothetical protein
MATFFGFLFFSPLMALFLGFVVWFLPAMMFPEQVARRRPRLFGYFATGYAILIVVSLYLLISAAGGHDAAPLLGTVASLLLLSFARQRGRGRLPGTQGADSWVKKWSRAFGGADGHDPDDHPDDGAAPRRGPRAVPPDARRTDPDRRDSPTDPSAHAPDPRDGPPDPRGGTPDAPAPIADTEPDFDFEVGDPRFDPLDGFDPLDKGPTDPWRRPRGPDGDARRDIDPTP